MVKKIWQQNMMLISGTKRPPEWGFAASPYLYENLLLIEAGATYALNKDSGEIIWKSKSYRPAYGTPAIFQPGGKTLVAVLKTDGLVLLDVKNGKTQEFIPWETSYRTNASTPIVRENKFLFPPVTAEVVPFSNGEKIVCENLRKQKPLHHMNHAILIDDHLYGFDGNVHMAGPKDFICMNFSTGEVKWRVTDKGLQVGSLIIAGKRMIVLGQRGELVISKVNANKFEEIVPRTSDRRKVLDDACISSWPALSSKCQRRFGLPEFEWVDHLFSFKSEPPNRRSSIFRRIARMLP